MTTVQSAIRTANTAKISPKYEMTINHAMEIIANTDGSIAAVGTAFKLGYVQGVKAERAAQRESRKESGA